MPQTDYYYTQNTVPGKWQANYDEAKVPPYTLPDLLCCNDNIKISTADEWMNKRRKEVMDFFENEMYGAIPPVPDKVEYELLSEKTDEFNIGAVRREIRLHFSMHNARKHSFDALIYLPSEKFQPAPVFIGLTFFGNHVVSPDPAIGITGLKGKKELTLQDMENMRGAQEHRFPLKTLLERGYGFMTASYHDIFPDRPDGWQESIYRLFYDEKDLPHSEYSNSAISAWAWGILRLADLAETLKEIDPGRMAVYGHSRLGKTALWAGANDKRFSLVCVNDSGCGGAALSRRLFGETLYYMCNRGRMGHWFRRDFWPKTLTPENLTMDQHGLIALVAPRAIAVHSATEDLWADPLGEYLSAYHAGKVFELFGKAALQQNALPPVGVSTGTDVSYYLRAGKHDFLPEDWMHYLEAADRVFF